MDSDEDDDDFFISATAIEEDQNILESVYVESKSPKGQKILKVNVIDEDQDKSEAIEHKQKGQLVDVSASQSDDDYDVQILDPPNLIDIDRRSFRKRHLDDANESPKSDPEYNASSTESECSVSEQKNKKSSSIASNFLEADEDEEFFDKIAMETRKKTCKSKQRSPNQSKRIFNVNFLSKIDGSLNKAVQLRVLGKYEISSVLPTVLERLVKKLQIPGVMADIYKPENVSLYWNNAKLLKFMSCNSLGITQSFENEVSDINILMVSSEHEKQFEENIRQQLLQEEAAAAEEALLRKQNHRNINIMKNIMEYSRIEQFEEELTNDRDLKPIGKLRNEEKEVVCINIDSEEEDLIKIALVGQDNQKVYVNVRPSTRLLKVTEYYRKHKHLSATTNLQLIFDHDELDLHQTVGQQEIEDEDMIEIVIR